MRDDGCPNQPSAADDPTGSSEEEEEILSKKAESTSVDHTIEEIGSSKW
jgi:hypothetical protein